MNIGELVKGVAGATNMSETAARVAIAAVFEQIAAAAARGEDIVIPGFGKFAVKDRPERESYNPTTRQVMTLAASRRVAFTAAKALKARL